MGWKAFLSSILVHSIIYGAGQTLYKSENFGDSNAALVQFGLSVASVVAVKIVSAIVYFVPHIMGLGRRRR